MFGENEIVGKLHFANEPEKTLVVTSMFMTLQGEGPFRGKPAFFIRLAKCNLACSFCFVGSTYITMGTGRRKKIKDIEVGEEVLSWDNDAACFKKKKVTFTYKNEAEELLKIDFSPTNTVWVTPEHPFLVKNKGWVKASSLLEGDVVLHLATSERMKHSNPMKNSAVAEKVSEKLRGKPGYLNDAWENDDFRRKVTERMLHDNPMKDPEVAIKGFLNRKDLEKKTCVEERFSELLKGHCEFVGNGSLIVNNLCPDFKVIGQRKLIEVWDDEQTDYWGRDEKYREARRAKLEKDGYAVLFLPFKKSDSDESIRERAFEFINNGYTVLKKTVITQDNRAAWTRFTGSKSAKTVPVYNLEVEGTHTYIANNLIVHNCDTFFDKGDRMSFGAINEKITRTIEEFYENRTDFPPEWAITRDMVLVITGGEPLLQENLFDFINSIGKLFTDVQIETNGTQLPYSVPHYVTLVVSPKCSEKKGVAIKYLNVRKQVLDRADCLKFVMSADKDSPYSTIPKWAHDWRKETGRDIYISPMNIYNDIPKKSKELRSGKEDISMAERSTVDEVISFWEPGLLDMEQNKRNHEYAGEYCMEHGLILNLQIQLYASLA